jgi:hypothetical protein
METLVPSTCSEDINENLTLNALLLLGAREMLGNFVIFGQMFRMI